MARGSKSGAATRGSGKAAGSGKGSGKAAKKGSLKGKAQKGSASQKTGTKLVFKIDCARPAQDEIFTAEMLDAFKSYLETHIKVGGKAGQLGEKVKVSAADNVVTVTAYMEFSKRYLKYLTKRYLKKQSLRDWLRVVSTSKGTYELKYFNIHDQDEEEGEE
eukprot:NODE_2041_length_665_cov_144.697026_g1991_i0.p1 GENE.NODE_2041_length_665_cov_144.697026_g1991_i0~~NODE_2041_length_665_cov_144.697026_g1991_i0.p1  ORF type:complete len:161 (+),score=51.31 NODE_2041_length_665_cov_144.697026_g1991_i0:83-565(+)